MYKIRFEKRTHQGVYGHKYWFYLKDAVDDVPEYVVHWDHFVKYVSFRCCSMAVHLRMLRSTAAEYGLQPLYMKEFHEVFADNQEHTEFGPLLERMKVVDANGESQMDEDQWEAASECSLCDAFAPCTRLSFRRHTLSLLFDTIVHCVCTPPWCLGNGATLLGMQIANMTPSSRL